MTTNPPTIFGNITVFELVRRAEDSDNELAKLLARQINFLDEYSPAVMDQVCADVAELADANLTHKLMPEVRDVVRALPRDALIYYFERLFIDKVNELVEEAIHKRLRIHVNLDEAAR